MLPMVAAALLVPIPPADLVVTHARVWTDGKLTQADTVGVRNGRFVYVGKADPRIVGPRTVIVNARDKILTPGLIDAHAHLTTRGITLLQLRLRDASSKGDFVRRVREYADRTPAGQWIQGRGWSAESWPEKEQPTKEWIDPFTADKPAYLVRMDGHSALANSAALRLAGITKDTPDPAGGVIDKDPATGEPTGMLRETAMSLVQVPPPAESEQMRGLVAAVRLANENGVTAVSDISALPHFETTRRYVSRGRPQMRFTLYAAVEGDWADEIRGLKAFRGVRGWAEPRGLKAYMDGSLGSRTAYMREPFTKPLPGQTNPRGVPMPGAIDGTYAKGFRDAARAGLQVMVHAIGDQANHDLLNLYSQVPGIANKRFRVEHVQHLLPADIGRFARLGVIPSMQPYHKADDGRYCEEVIGTDRSKSSYTFASLLKSGARLAFGSDWSVVTINPFEGINTAVTGKILTGHVWMPHENLTFDQALVCYTKHAAYAMGWEKEIGSVRPGYRADFLILEGDPYRPGVDYAGLKPAKVYVAGRLVAPEPQSAISPQG